MKTFTLIEVVVLILVIGCLLLLTRPAFDGHPIRAPKMHCANNLKQIAVSLHMFATDHRDQFPTHVPSTNGGSMELLERGSPAPHFKTISDMMLLKSWICPTDRLKKAPTNYATFDDRNLSYFLSLDAVPTTASARFIPLAGDRHLEFAGKPVPPGLFMLTTNVPLGWTRELHSDSFPAGVMLFVDGHTEFLKSSRVVTAAQQQGLATNRLAVP